MHAHGRFSGEGVAIGKRVSEGVCQALGGFTHGLFTLRTYSLHLGNYNMLPDKRKAPNRNECFLRGKFVTLRRSFKAALKGDVVREALAGAVYPPTPSRPEGIVTRAGQILLQLPL